MKKFFKVCSLVVVLIGLMAFNASATYMTGNVSFTGLDTNTGSTLSFSDVLVGTGTGTWAGVSPANTTGAIFNTVTYNPVTVPITPYLWTFTVINSPVSPYTTTYTMSGLTMTVVNAGASYLDISGTGLISVTSTYPLNNNIATPGTYDITTQGGTGTFTFSATSTAAPEPMTLLLLGFGLVGVAGIRRKMK
jgi:hypothetical protein